MNRRVILMQHCLTRRVEKLCRQIEKTESELGEDTFKGFFPVFKPPVIHMTPELKERFIKDFEKEMNAPYRVIPVIDVID